METQSRMPGCQSTNHTECYGELWQCQRCGKIVCCAEGTDNDPGLCDDCWVEVHPLERRKPCPKMQALIEQLMGKHQCNMKEAGMELWLALPNSNERLMIAGLSSQRVSLTHCVADAEGHLSLDLDLVFVVYETQLEPVELVHSLEIGHGYFQATGEDANNSEVDLARFSEYLANLLEAKRWVIDGHRLPG